MNNKNTNWDEYYNNVSGLSKYTRLYTQNWLISQISNTKFSNIKLAEFGGGNSCFHDAVIEKCNIASYTIYDNNEVGISKFDEKYNYNGISKSINCDLLNNEIVNSHQYDLVYSVGLIEHFDKEGTKNIVKKHFDAVKPGGIVIITAPTPTYLYKLIRSCAELCGVWKFHDERALSREEMHSCVIDYGDIVSEKLLWAIGLTQYAIVVKAK